MCDCVSVKMHGRGAVFAIPADSRQEYTVQEREREERGSRYRCYLIIRSQPYEMRTAGGDVVTSSVAIMIRRSHSLTQPEMRQSLYASEMSE